MHNNNVRTFAWFRNEDIIISNGVVKYLNTSNDKQGGIWRETGGRVTGLRDPPTGDESDVPGWDAFDPPHWSK